MDQDKVNEVKMRAREWAITETTDSDDDLKRAALDFILATTLPTMAEVEWDEDEHYLAGCETSSWSVVMLRRVQGENVLVHNLDCGVTEVYDRGDLTPNGKRYKIVEITTPEYLETEDDYKNAPVGTIMAVPRQSPLCKIYTGEWRGLFDHKLDVSAGEKYQVLRWGRGEEA